MRFDTLNKTIPYVVGGKKHFFTSQIYPGVEISMPGRHQHDTAPVGGDAVVLLTDEALDWNRHRFTHTDIFADIELKAGNVPDSFWTDYAKVIKGGDPAKFDYHRDDAPGLHPMTFLYGSQVLAVIEHRRYAKFEAKFGGRYLPFRFGAGIVEGLWTATDAAERQKRGRPGVEWLEKDFGTPTLTKELMS